MEELTKEYEVWLKVGSRKNKKILDWALLKIWEVCVLERKAMRLIEREWR